MTTKRTGKTNEKRSESSQNNDNRNPYSDANMEQATCDEPLAKDEGKKNNPRFRVHCTSHRKRLADFEGVSYKAFIDGIVEKGILPTDTTKDIDEKGSTTQQVKSSEEKTVIVIEEI